MRQFELKHNGMMLFEIKPCNGTVREETVSDGAINTRVLLRSYFQICFSWDKVGTNVSNLRSLEQSEFKFTWDFL